MSPTFLSVDEVLEIHEYQIAQFGGDAAVRDGGLLDSAVAQASAQFGGQYLHEDLAAMAAAYLLHIVQNRPFADGNKRTRTHAALVFLELNGIDMEVPVDEAEALVLRVAQGLATKSEVAEFLRGLTRS